MKYRNVLMGPLEPCALGKRHRHVQMYGIFGSQACHRRVLDFSVHDRVETKKTGLMRRSFPFATFQAELLLFFALLEDFSTVCRSCK